jgi:hypothetical protein
MAAVLVAGGAAVVVFGGVSGSSSVLKTEGRGAPEPYTNMPCMMFNDTYIVHLASYVAQGAPDPEAKRSKIFKPYCQTLPSPGKIAFAIDLMDKEIRKIPIRAGVYRGSADLEAIVEKPAKAYPTGAIELAADFDKPGAYIIKLIFGEGKRPDDTLLIPVTVK